MRPWQPGAPRWRNFQPVRLSTQRSTAFQVLAGTFPSDEGCGSDGSNRVVRVLHQWPEVGEYRTQHLVLVL